MPTQRLTVIGHVQGVGFRYHTARVAEAFDIGGTVGNQPDGNVVIVAAGTPENLRSFREQVELGPTGARVDQVIVENLPEQRFERFTVVR